MAPVSKRATNELDLSVSLGHSYLKLQKQPERTLKGPPLSSRPHCIVIQNP